LLYTNLYLVLWITSPLCDHLLPRACGTVSASTLFLEGRAHWKQEWTFRPFLGDRILGTLPCLQYETEKKYWSRFICGVKTVDDTVNSSSVESKPPVEDTPPCHACVAAEAGRDRIGLALWSPQPPARRRPRRAPHKSGSSYLPKSYAAAQPRAVLHTARVKRNGRQKMPHRPTTWPKTCSTKVRDELCH